MKVLSILSVAPEPHSDEAIGSIVPVGTPADLLPLAFLDDEGEGTEWGWSDWDALDWRDLQDLVKL